jgi:hypothetical protein
MNIVGSQTLAANCSVERLPTPAAGGWRSMLVMEVLLRLRPASTDRQPAGQEHGIHCFKVILDNRLDFLQEQGGMVWRPAGQFLPTGQISK